MEDLKEQTIVLDGKRITESEFEKEKQKKDIRIIPLEENQGTFKTLKRLYD